jgi:hypothetical protein
MCIPLYIMHRDLNVVHQHQEIIFIKLIDKIEVYHDVLFN